MVIHKYLYNKTLSNNKESFEKDLDKLASKIKNQQ